MTSPRCRICDNAHHNRTLTAREMMFGMRDPFEYLVCGACGCVQIVAVPNDLARYYPDDYYAYGVPHRDGRARALLQHLFGQRNPIGWAMVRRYGVPPSIEQLRVAGMDRDASLLDVGCGAGELLLALRCYGFRNPTGVDPFVANDIDYGNGVRVWKRTLDQHDGCYDFVTLHHTFEHMDRPGAVLARIVQMLNPGGVVLLRLPLASGEAFERYGADWVQLDAPRHLYLHTPQSLEHLAQVAGLEIFHTEFAIRPPSTCAR